MNSAAHWMGLLTALGVGLLIGVVRERRHQPGRTKAGTRTHALVAMLGYVSWSLGTCPFVVTVLVIGALVIGGYQATAQSDHGQTRGGCRTVQMECPGGGHCRLFVASPTTA